MSKENDDILGKINHRDGLTVPEGYFADFAARMEQQLPEKAPAPIVKPVSTWHRIRPYVYMAAMFAGVWCMLKMFTLMSGPSEAGIDGNPTLADAVGNDAFIDEYYIDDINQYDMFEEMMEDGFDANDISEDGELLDTVETEDIEEPELN